MLSEVDFSSGREFGVMKTNSACLRFAVDRCRALRASDRFMSMTCFRLNPDLFFVCQNRWLALHGFLDNAATFDNLAPEMLSLGASSVVCLDLAGATPAARKMIFETIDIDRRTVSSLVIYPRVCSCCD